MLKNLYLVIGESGSGKDTVVNTLCSEHQLTKVLSYTTREPRYEGEDTHTFISAEEAMKLPNIVAETIFDGKYYCATQEQVDKADFYIIDKIGFELFEKLYKGRPYKVIYITAPSFVRQQRMSQRGDDGESVINRIENDNAVFRGVNRIADCVIQNIDLDETVREVWDFIRECEEE